MIFVAGPAGHHAGPRVVFRTAGNPNMISAKITWTISSAYGGFPPITTHHDQPVAVAGIQGPNTSD